MAKKATKKRSTKKRSSQKKEPSDAQEDAPGALDESEGDGGSAAPSEPQATPSDAPEDSEGSSSDSKGNEQPKEDQETEAQIETVDRMRSGTVRTRGTLDPDELTKKQLNVPKLPDKPKLNEELPNGTVRSRY